MNTETTTTTTVPPVIDGPATVPTVDPGPPWCKMPDRSTFYEFTLDPEGEGLSRDFMPCTPCSTGVINELGGCEPVGTPNLAQPAIEIDVGVIVPDEHLTYPPQAPEATVTASTVQVQPPTLPETGTSPYAPQFGVIGGLSIIIGTMLAVIARSTK